MKYHHEPIDAVITWVDGNDPAHREKRLLALREETHLNEVSTGRDITRFIDNGELSYCIGSIRKFAPWIHKIHLVTDGQIPRFLTKDMQKAWNVHIVDHSDIFQGYEWALPTFNTRTIESALWRIPGLAPYFIYLNDDFIITRDVLPTHFFKNDHVRLQGMWSSISHYGKLRLEVNRLGNYLAKHFLGITRSMHLLLQMRSAQVAGFRDMYYRAPHVPHPVRTETLQEFFALHPGLFEDNIRYRFRNMEQFSAIFLSSHLEIKHGNAILQKPQAHMMINGETDLELSIRLKLRKISDDEIRFLCLQGFEFFSGSQRAVIRRTLNNHLMMPEINRTKYPETQRFEGTILQPEIVENPGELTDGAQDALSG
jgi:hypothetical protein